MLATETIFAFVIATTLVCLSPGPSNLFIMARTLQSGIAGGVMSAVGMAVGSLIYVFASVIGLSAVIALSPTLFVLIKLVGALYLIWLGVHGVFFSSAISSQQQALPKRHLFRQALIVELSNPKTALFFIAFLPQFTRPEAGDIALQLALLGIIYSVIAFSCDVLVTNLSHQFARIITRKPELAVRQQQVGGAILLGLGIYILISEVLLFVG